MEEKIIYLAGLFDGEGCVTYKQRLEHRKGKPRPYLYWQIRLEINMIDKYTIDYVANTFACGSRDYRKPYPHQNYGQHRWQCTHRDAFKVAKLLLPYAITKKEKLKQIVNHYTKEEA